MNNLGNYLIGLFGILASCTNNTKDSGTNTFLEHRHADTIPYTRTELYEFSPYIKKSEGKLDSTYYRASFVTSKDSRFNDLIFRSMGIEDEEALKQSAEAFLTAYNNYTEEAPYPELVHTWFHETDNQVLLYTPNILVINTKTAEYTGGAHGNYFELLFNYDLKKMKPIALNDIMGKDKTKEFLNIAEKYFRNQEGLGAQTSLEDDYFFDNGTFTLADNYVFSKDALVFQYNPYEIKSYAEGMTTVTIPYDEIEHLLNAEGKAYIGEIKKYYN